MNRRPPASDTATAPYGPTVGLVEAAAILKVHPKTVADYIGAGALPAARVGRAYVMMTRDVVQLVERMIQEQTAARLRAPRRPETSPPKRSP